MIRYLELFRGDFANARRDPMLVLAGIAPLLIALMLHFGLPLVDIGPYAALTTAFMLLMPAYLFGMVIGFMLLEERDEHVLRAIAVSPLRMRGFLVYRLTLPVAISFVAGLGMAGVMIADGFVAPMPAARLVAVMLATALTAPLPATFLAAFATDKVQGLAFAKAAGVVLMTPLALLFAAPVRYVGAFTPYYWIVWCFENPDAGSVPFWAAVGAAIALVTGALTFFVRKIRV